MAHHNQNDIPSIIIDSSHHNTLYKASLTTLGLTCASCVSAVERAVKLLPSVITESVVVNLLTGDTRFNFTDPSLTTVAISDAITNIGYEVDSVTVQPQNIEHKSATNDIKTPAQISDVTSTELPPTTTRLSITGMSCASCVNTIQDTLQKLPGVLSVNVNLLLNEALIEHLSRVTGPRDLIDAVNNVGYDAKLMVTQSNKNMIRERVIKQQKLLQRRFLISLAAGIPTFLIAMVIMLWLPNDNPVRMKLQTQITPGLDIGTLILFTLATPVQFYLGAPFYIKAYKSLRYAHAANMETLVAIGTSVAYFGSIANVIMAMTNQIDSDGMQFFETSVFLITFIWLGKWMEAMAKGKTLDSITKLMELQPDKAILVKENKVNGDEEIEEEVDLALIQVGDTLKVNAGAKFPCDGVIIRGITTIDESMLTGEPIPIAKSKGEQVMSATVNLTSPTWIRVTHVGSDTTLFRIINLVHQAQASKKAPIEVLADKISQYFVPTVILISLVDFVIWIILGATNAIPKEWIPEHQSYLVFALFFAISVLVIACPCAMGLASPTAIMVGTGVAARLGILIKGGGEAVQMASRINTIAFDKTGTLTYGKPKVVNSELYVDAKNELIEKDRQQREELLLHILGSVESASDHPLARAVSQYILAKLQPDVHQSDADESRSFASLTGITLDAVTEVPGKGLQATVTVSAPQSSILLPHKLSSSASHQLTVYVGNYDWIDSLGFAYPPDISKQKTQSTLTKWRQQGQSVVVAAMDMNAVGKTGTDTDANANANNSRFIIAQFGIADVVRPDSVNTINALKSMGIDVWMITGDHPIAAKEIARQVGIDNVLAQVTPENKAEKIKWLQRRQQDYAMIKNTKSPIKMLKKLPQEEENPTTASVNRPVVAMVGDGINDAPALAQADLGISIASGTDIAIESSSVILTRSTLASLITMIRLSQAIIKRIRINFMWAFLYNSLAIPIAAGVFFPIFKIGLPPELAGLAMVVSSISVIMSSLLLKRFKERE
ncbi:7290_t:CDS:2 [Paraglomus occultum]|uniref:P-type Cu(+) transporter n=1 Tax=Paraglomus occultum TaxID=144539 RepID=A0A9N9B442_9GLOM|nr:7290_t:CDS:2 [Paraglomus occultum]